jgi:hypothetical protein
MELLRFPSHRGFSVRSIVTFVLTVIITALLWTALSSTATHAAGTATWQGGSTILFDNHGYTQATDFSDPTGTIPAGSQIYKSAVQNSSQSSVSPKIFILYFTPGVDPPTATSVKYVEFDYKDGKVSNPQNKQDVAATPQDAGGNSGTSCSVSGVGWIICPMSVFLADAMDNIFGILASMIAVKPPVLGDTTNSMYVTWNIMRSIANIAFVIVFLIIIYAQLTNIAVSNYGLKKLIPRLIIAAVLVNVSYFIAALAIDVSNILGYSVQTVFNTIREQTFHLTNDNVSGLNTNTWGAVAAAALAGGGVVGGIFYVANGGPYLLVAVLIGLLLTVLFVVLILAARQAIIVILVVIAPLAFVANLLPNTEKWFEKWKDLFFTMLIFFPAFSLVFGGSQLAGQIIIQNAGDNIVMLIFGMAVQIAPLVITPLILKFSGGLLGRIAQIANNPRKGLIDRSRNWGERHAELAKQRNIARGLTWRNENGKRRVNPAALGAGMVRRMDYRKRRLSDNTDIWKQEATNRYDQTRQVSGKHGDQRSLNRSISARKASAELDKERIHNEHSAHLENLKVTPGSRLYDRALNTQASKDQSETAQAITTAHFERERVRGGAAVNAASLNLYNAGLELENSKAQLEANTSAKNAFYNDERVRVGSTLYNSAYNAEIGKANLEASEAAKNAFYTNQRSTAGTRLNAVVDNLETSKVRLEGAQSRYAATVDEMKLNPGTMLYSAAQTAQSAKDHAEATQVRLQSFFDEERTRTGSVLNTSYAELERAKITSEGIKTELTQYTTEAKTVGGTLHTEFIQTERVKQAQQVSEARLARIVEEYKAGGAKDAAGNTFIDGVAVSPAEQLIVDDMVQDGAYLYAEKQGAASAQYEVQRNIAESMTEGTPLTDSLLDIAQGVGGEAARVRAQAQAVANKDKLDSDALGSNVQLLKNEAKGVRKTIKKYSAGIVESVLNGDTHDESGREITPERLKAALQAQADEKNMSLFERVRGSRNFQQSMVSEVIALNVGNFKVAGGFHMQEDPSLNIENYASDADFDRAMQYSRVQSLANASASGLSDVKFGWLANFANTNPADGPTLQENINAALAQPDGQKYLRMAYSNVRDALTNDDIRATIGDREDEIRVIEAALAGVFHQNKTPDPRPRI